MGNCSTCDNEAAHYIDYSSLKGPVAWSGVYCTKCFVKKLRGMATVWSKRK